MSSLKPITVYFSGESPNPWKVVIILEELSLPYTLSTVAHGDIKRKPFTDLNPNGRVPAIHDPNTNVTLWESGAINFYLVDTYDTAHKISYTTSPEKYLVQQWLHFQMSGQGPYYGQAMWFTHFHPEKIPSAINRYVREIERVIMVLDTWLSIRKAKGEPEYLVGDKATFADLAFITWHSTASTAKLADDKDGTPVEGSELDVKGNYPTYDSWMTGLLERPAVRKAMEGKNEARKKRLAAMAEMQAKKD